ncbi:RNA-binding domain-containing protein [Rickenella mellea]|uniref:RNA-binding domain-containing protein n=1 Tax=Rickenella mellea TaxID=50990 RepID=A0A4R5XGI9_9AGAM|nr:RNA-binding domain-containing protein [Rickenella mellea]
MADAPAATVTENGLSPAAQADETPGFKVFAGNLAYSVNDEGLKAFFAPVQSDILSAQVILRGTRSAGYGFVALSTLEAAQMAVDALNKKDLDGRAVIVEIAKPADQKDKERTERRANRKPGRRGNKAVPGEVTDAEANGEAAKPEDSAAEGEQKIKKKKKAPRNKRKAKQGEGSATEGAAETTPAEGKESATEEGSKKKSPKARRPARAPRPAGEDPAGEPSKTMLFVANLSFNIDDAGLSKLFTDAGIHVNSARVVKRRWGQPRKSKGYGFVDVGSEEEQKKAIAALEGKELEGGRQIAVKVAVNSERDDDENDEKAPEAATTA